MTPAMPSRTIAVTANGVRFVCAEVGDGPLALCLHGFPDSPTTWRHLMPALAAAGYRAVAPFLRAFAPTAIPPDGACQVGALVADAIALHEALGGDGRAVLVGHGFGALAGYGATAHAPERWRRAVGIAVGPIGGSGMPAGFLDYEQLRRSFAFFLFQTPLAEPALAADDMAFIDGLWRDWAPGYDSTGDAARAKDCVRDPAHLRAILDYYRSSFDAGRRSPAYAAEEEALNRPPGRPTLYLHGGVDGRIDRRYLRGVDGLLGEGGRVVVVEAAGHFPQLERPAEVNRLVLDWLAA